jgi:hypothetical protein
LVCEYGEILKDFGGILRKPESDEYKHADEQTGGGPAQSRGEARNRVLDRDREFGHFW